MSSDTDMQGDDDRAYGTVAEVAAAYGVSPDTIRRRMRKGDLQARRETIPSGYRWLLPMPAPGETLPGHEQAVSPALDSTTAAMLDTLQRELQARSDEIARLHTLLEVQARALEAAMQRPALPPSPESEAVESPRIDETSDTGISTPVNAWKRLLRALRGA